MSDYRRWRIEGGAYCFTLATHQRREWLTEPLARACLRESFRIVRLRRPFTINAIVLLPEHLHAVWTLPQGDNDYSTRWQLIKRRFTRLFLAQGGRDGVLTESRLQKQERGLWQRRFYEHTCRDEDDFKRCIDYVHINPVKHGLVIRVADWQWSSFHRYVKLGEYPPDWGNAADWFGDEWIAFE